MISSLLALLKLTVNTALSPSSTVTSLMLTVGIPSSSLIVVAKQVKAEFLHAWNAYTQYAWGHDALKPLSKTPHDWYGLSRTE